MSGGELGTYLSRQAADQAAPSLRVHSGRVVSWGPTVYSVEVLGNVVEGISYLAAAASVVPGDVIALLKYRTSYLALGKITTP